MMLPCRGDNKDDNHIPADTRLACKTLNRLSLIEDRTQQIMQTRGVLARLGARIGLPENGIPNIMFPYTNLISSVIREAGNGADLLVGGLRRSRSISGPEWTKYKPIPPK
jgi:hypothetical protein